MRVFENDKPDSYSILTKYVYQGFLLTQIVYIPNV